ncbi:MAG: sigma-70 family RNA polymerase sigma factor [Clostridia bacterium]|nr:sigma-70 family RNA polymerase sigma factor [Clostridia bacterium]
MDNLQEDVLRTKYGDNEAFRRLLDAYRPMISSLVTEFSRFCPTACINEDDLGQEAAIALYFAALSYKPDKGVSFGLYAKICTKNRLTSYVQKSIAKSLSQMISDCIDDCFEDEPAADDDQQPLNLIISKENCDALKKRIRAELTDCEYSVFMLSADGDAPSEISKKLGVNVKSVYNTLQRVRQKLRRLI